MSLGLGLGASALAPFLEALALGSGAALTGARRQQSSFSAWGPLGALGALGALPVPLVVAWVAVWLAAEPERRRRKEVLLPGLGEMLCKFWAGSTGGSATADQSRVVEVTTRGASAGSAHHGVRAARRRRPCHPNRREQACPGTCE